MSYLAGVVLKDPQSQRLLQFELLRVPPLLQGLVLVENVVNTVQDVVRSPRVGDGRVHLRRRSFRCIALLLLGRLDGQKQKEDALNFFFR